MAYARAMEIYNLYGDEWNETTEHEGFAFKDGWVGARIGAELIGGSLYEVPPGKKLWPYHTHHGERGVGDRRPRAADATDARRRAGARGRRRRLLPPRESRRASGDQPHATSRCAC